jgi:spore germination protein GerM
VYFARIEANDVQFVPVIRTMPRTPAMGRAAILELLKGPTQQEKDSGLQTAIPAGVELKNLRIQDGTAFADFNKALNEGVGGSLAANTVRSQVTLTLQQFATVKKVIIAVEGRTEDILQP